MLPKLLLTIAIFLREYNAQKNPWLVSSARHFGKQLAGDLIIRLDRQIVPLSIPDIEMIPRNPRMLLLASRMSKLRGIKLQIQQGLSC